LESESVIKADFWRFAFLLFDIGSFSLREIVSNRSWKYNHVVI